MDIFKAIKSIQATDKNELNHTLKDLLISILIRFGENGYIWADNTQIGAWIGEDSEYVKNLLSKLKKKNYLNLEGRKSQRKIYPGAKLVRDPLSRNLDVRDPLSRTVDTPIKKKNIKEKSGAAPDSFLIFHPYLDEIIEAIPKPIRPQISRVFVNKCLHEKNGDRPYFYFLIDKCMGKSDPAAWLVAGMRGYYAQYLNEERRGHDDAAFLHGSKLSKCHLALS